MRTIARVATGLLPVLAALASAPGIARADAGEIVQTDNLGATAWMHNFTTDKTTTIGDPLVLSEFIGAHSFVTDDVRLGLNVQLGELLGPAPAGASRFQTFALLPQVGWNFRHPFFAALVPTVVLRSGGKNQLDLGVQLVGGASFAVTRRLSAGVALEVPYYFLVARKIGLTPLAGIAWKM